MARVALGVQRSSEGVVHEQRAGAGGVGAHARYFSRHAVDTVPEVSLGVGAVVCTEGGGIDGHDAVVVGGLVPVIA